MYVLKEETKTMLLPYKLKAVAETVGMNYDTLSKMIKQNKPCIKLTAYCITKYLDSEKEILDFFDRKEK